MNYIILTLHILVAILLIGSVLLQNSKGGLQSGLTGGEFYRTKRGAERIVFLGTIILVIFFFLTSLANMLVR